MKIDSEIVLRQLDSIIKRYNESKRWKDLPYKQTIALITSIKATIERLAPINSPYLETYQAIDNEHYDENSKIESMMGIIEALREDYQNGFLSPLQDLIRAEIFTDFIDMAEYLLESGYKDPAAVITGGVLEQQLRDLCIKNEIPLQVDDKPKKADQMNNELAQKAVHTKLDQKGITSWLDLRNKAAHGQYASYNQEQVRIFIMGLKDYIRRVAG